MTKMSSTMFSVGTLLRRAEDTGAEVKVLVQDRWLTGHVLGCDGLGAVLDDGEGSQSLVRLDQIAAVTFSRAAMEDDLVDTSARAHGGGRGPIEAGPVAVRTRAAASSPSACCTASPQSRTDDLPRLLLHLGEVLRAAERLGVDLVDVLGAAGARGKPRRLGGDLEATDLRAVARRLGKLPVMSSPASDVALTSSGESAPSSAFSSRFAGASIRAYAGSPCWATKPA